MAAEQSSESKEKIVADVGSLLNYLEELVKKYPQGITQKELAELASVTSGAVSKIKDRLLHFCDLTIFAYESKFMLKPDLTVFQLMLNEFWNDSQYLKVLVLISTPYGEEVLVKKGIYDLISTKIPILTAFLTDEEIKLGARILLRYIRSFTTSEGDFKKAKKIADYARNLDLADGGENFLVGLLLGNVIRKTDLDWPIETATEMQMVISIRDKLFYLIKDLLSRFTDNLSIIDELETKRQKNSFKKMYRVTTDFYLKKVFTAITDSLELTAKKKKIDFPDSYRVVGNDLFSGVNQ